MLRGVPFGLHMGPVITKEGLLILLFLVSAVFFALVLLMTVGVALVVAGALTTIRLGPTPGAVAWAERKGVDMHGPTFKGEFASMIPVTLLAPCGYLALAVWVAGESLLAALFLVPFRPTQFARLYGGGLLLCFLLVNGYHYEQGRGDQSRR